MLRWSRHCQPQVVHGHRPLVPCTMAPGLDRLAYLQGAVDNAALLLGAGLPEATVRGWLATVPLVGDLVSVEAGAARARPGAAAQLSFDPRALGVSLLDGRQRRRRGTIYLGTGEHTARFAEVLGPLARGVDEAELTARLGGDAGLTNLVAALESRGAIERGEVRAPRRHHGPEQLTWMGHASVVLEAHGSVVWVDPLAVPDITWGEADAPLLSDEHADAALFDGARAPRPLGEWPTPDVILLTHQDRDHVDLGTLMGAPPEALIVVPAASPDRPWEVDLAALIRRTLGERRRVRALAHGESVEVGALRVTALPFVGEMPASLPHAWNCYEVVGPAQRVVFLADARLDAAGVERLAERSRDGRPLTLLAGPPRTTEVLPGWREGIHAGPAFAGERLWGWYVPPVRLFEPVQCTNLDEGQLRALRERAALAAYYPYAVGNAPWFRLTDPDDAFHLPVTSLSRAELSAVEATVARAGVKLLAARYGRPVSL